MENVRKSAVADIFYPSNPEKLKKQINDYIENIEEKYEYCTRAVIVPHAGLIFSGQLACEGINLLSRDIKNIFIFAPAHRVSFDGIALSSYEKWQTPLGEIEINQDINRELKEKFKAKFFDEGHKEEHSIEVQIPIIQSIYNNVKIIPVLIGKENIGTIFNILNEYYKNKDFGFIISSDLSHYHDDEIARKIDISTARMIETGITEKFSFGQACNAVGVCGLVEFANSLNYSLIRVGMLNSSLVTKDKTKVVGYGSWALYEGSRNNFIKKYYSDYLVNLCRDIILSKHTQNPVATNHMPVFDEYGACFVTLKKKDSLRGCIGSILAYQPLINDIVQNSLKSAYQDSRFSPVAENEMQDIKVSISLLSTPVSIKFSDENDLLNQIVPFKDGIIIKDKEKLAVYLPSVWESFDSKKEFLNSLKKKAGLSPDYFSETFEAFRFEAEYIEED